MQWFRQAFRRHRSTFLLFLLIETFYSVGGLQVLRAQEETERLAEAESAAMARVFGWGPESLTESRGDRLGRTVEGLHGRWQDVLTETETGIEQLLASATTWLGQGASAVGSASPSAATVTGAEAPSSAPRPRLLRSAAPVRTVGALAEGDGEGGERTLAPSPFSDPQFGGQKAISVDGTSPSTADRLPLRRVERRAARVEASAFSSKVTASSAVASPGRALRETVAQRAEKSVAPEIAALASSLGNSPSRIFAWVHNHIDYDPKWGADSPPLGTLWERQGTSWDQAWLLQELLLAAGVDARLEWGDVEIDPALLLEITGVDDPIRAGDLLATAGLPVLLVVSGSQVIAARFPHAWVKAHLDYIPNRGVTPGSGDTWIRMDPSLKTFERQEGLRLDAEVPFVLADHLQSATALSPRDDYEAALLAYAADQGLPISSLDELAARRSVLEESFPFVPGTLRAKILSVAGESDAVPASQQVRLDLEVRAAVGGQILDWSTTLPQVWGRLLEVRWPGATSADQSTLDLFGGVYGTPPYEVNLRPAIALDGAEVAGGTAIGSAEDAELSVTVTPPAGLTGDGVPIIARWEMFAGEHGALNVDLGRASQEMVDRLLATAAAATEPDAIEAWSLAAAGARYLAVLGEDLDHLAALRWQRAQNYGTAVLAVQRGAVSTTADGTPDTFSLGPLALDVGARTLGLFPVDGVQVSTVPTLELLGSQGSVREGEALAEVFGGDHVTAVGFLKLAVGEGQTLTRVDAGNLDAALAAATLSRGAEGAVAFAVGQGAIAWISESQLEIGGWRTTGYIIEDPDTGGGGYFVTFERRFTPLDGAVIFHTPIDLDVVTAPTDVIATIDVEGIESWTLSTRPTGEEGTQVIATGTGPVQETLLGQFDPTVLLNGMHELVLSGRDAAGQSVTGLITLVVEGNMKIGNFSLAFLDLAINLAGLDIEIMRTYDSRQRHTRGDFGYGWSLDIRQGSYKNNRPPGDGWQLAGGTFPCQGAVETKSHLTTVRLSDREVYRFRTRLGGIAPILGGCLAQAGFQLVDGTFPGARLEPLGNGRVLYQNGSDFVLDFDTLELYEPQGVKLTTRDGRVFDLDLDQGVQRIAEANGNEVRITPTSISHSSGVGVSIERGADGGIERIVDPAGEAIQYQRDGLGDLIRVTDRTAAETQFTYASDHRLETIVDALGRTPIRSEYDDRGRLIRHIDATGQVFEFDHDVAGRQEVLTDRQGRSTVLTYDERGNIVREVDSEGRETLRTYDDEDNLLSETDPLGRVTTKTYTAANEVASETDALGNTTHFTYDGAGRVLTTTDARGAVVQMTYDAGGNVLQEIDATGAVTTFTYDASGRRLSETDALGRTTSAAYDGRGNRIRSTDPLGNETLFEYDDLGRLVRETSSRTLPDGTIESVETSTEVDAEGRVTRTVSADGSVRQQVFDDLGRLVQRIDPLGRVTETVYDELGNHVATRHPDGSSETMEYNAEGQLVATTDRAGRTTSMTYDASGRLVDIIRADGSTTSNTYDAVGQLIEQTDPRGNVSRFTYDAAGRTLAVTNGVGETMVREYDAAGSLQKVTDPLGRTTTVNRDLAGREIGRTLPDGSTLALQLDALGQVVAQTDSAGDTTQFEYESRGLLTRVIDPLGQTTTFTYDETGQRISQTDANGNTTRFEYDPQGRLVARILADGAVQRFEYHPDGSLARKIGARGVSTLYTYDGVGNLIRRESSEGEVVTFTYTPLGQRASYTDALGTTQLTWNEQDQLASVSHADGRSLEYVYDAVGNRTELIARTPTTTLTTRYAYDGADRLSTVTDTVGGVYSYAYDANGNRTQLSHPNGVTTTTAFDTVNRLTSLSTATASGTVLQSYLLTLDAAGRRTRIDEAGGQANTYAYDAAGRLTSASLLDNGGATLHQQDFTYDAVGNRAQSRVVDDTGAETTSVYAYDVRDRLLSVDGTTYAYDQDGNLTQRQSAGSDLYSWDTEDRLRQVELDDGTVVESFYDPDGNLARQIVDRVGEEPVAIDYLVDVSGDLSHVVVESDGAGNVLSHYVRGNELLAVLRPATGEQRYVHGDAVGSVRVLSDANGSVTDRYRYSAFGELLERQGDDPQPYGFTGEPFQADMGLAYHRARWLDASVGRFIGVDPFAGIPSDPISLHRYLYAHADPANRVDPTGRAAAAAAVAGARLAGATIGLAILRKILITLARQFLLAGLAALITFGTVALAQALARDPAVIRARDRLKEKIDRLKKRKRLKDLLYHYTGKWAALAIVSTGFIIASPAKPFGGFTFPSGAYGTDIPPFNPFMTQRQLSALFYGGNTQRDVSWFVAFEKLDFIPLLYTGFPSQWYRPAPPGFRVPIRRFFAGPTLMAP